MDKVVYAKLRAMHPYLRRELAKKCGISFNYLNKLTYDKSARPSPALAVRIERYTDGGILREQMRPDIWR